MDWPDRSTDGERTEHHGWRNLTPHPLRICGPLAPSDGCDMVLLPWPELPPLRLEEDGPTENAEVLHTERPRRHGMNGWTLRTITYRAPATMPPVIDGVRWIVSLPCLLGLAAAGLSRPDLFAPDTGAGAIRDEKGVVVGTQGFVRLADAPSSAGSAEVYRDLASLVRALRPILELHRHGAQGAHDALFADFERLASRLGA